MDASITDKRRLTWRMSRCDTRDIPTVKKERKKRERIAEQRNISEKGSKEKRLRRANEGIYNMYHEREKERERQKLGEKIYRM